VPSSSLSRIAPAKEPSSFVALVALAASFDGRWTLSRWTSTWRRTTTSSSETTQSECWRAPNERGRIQTIRTCAAVGLAAVMPSQQRLGAQLIGAVHSTTTSHCPELSDDTSLQVSPPVVSVRVDQNALAAAPQPWVRVQRLNLAPTPRTAARPRGCHEAWRESFGGFSPPRVAAGPCSMALSLCCLCVSHGCSPARAGAAITFHPPPTPTYFVGRVPSGLLRWCLGKTSGSRYPFASRVDQLLTSARERVPVFALVYPRLPLSLTRVGGALDDSLIESSMPAPLTIIYIHGNACDAGQCRDLCVELCVNLRVNVVVVELSGFGTSSAKEPLEATTHSDLSTVYEWTLRQSFCAGPEHIIAMGDSVGCGPAARLAAQRPLRGLILHVPMTSAVHVLTQSDCWTCLLRPCDVYRALPELRNAKCPVFLAHGRLDMVVPLDEGRAVEATVQQASLKAQQREALLAKSPRSTAPRMMERTSNPLTLDATRRGSSPTVADSLGLPPRPTGVPGGARIECWYPPLADHYNLRVRYREQYYRRLRGFLTSLTPWESPEWVRSYIRAPLIFGDDLVDVLTDFRAALEKSAGALRTGQSDQSDSPEASSSRRPPRRKRHSLGSSASPVILQASKALRVACRPFGRPPGLPALHLGLFSSRGLRVHSDDGTDSVGGGGSVTGLPKRVRGGSSNSPTPPPTIREIPSHPSPPPTPRGMSSPPVAIEGEEEVVMQALHHPRADWTIVRVHPTLCGVHCWPWTLRPHHSPLVPSYAVTLGLPISSDGVSGFGIAGSSSGGMSIDTSASPSSAVWVWMIHESLRSREVPVSDVLGAQATSIVHGAQLWLQSAEQDLLTDVSPLTMPITSSPTVAAARVPAQSHQGAVRGAEGTRARSSAMDPDPRGVPSDMTPLDLPSMGWRDDRVSRRVVRSVSWSGHGPPPSVARRHAPPPPTGERMLELSGSFSTDAFQDHETALAVMEQASGSSGSEEDPVAIAHKTSFSSSKGDHSTAPRRRPLSRSRSRSILAASDVQPAEPAATEPASGSLSSSSAMRTAHESSRPQTHRTATHGSSSNDGSKKVRYRPSLRQHRANTPDPRLDDKGHSLSADMTHTGEDPTKESTSREQRFRSALP
jgi:abhydrolase domain-containing protein 17